VREATFDDGRAVEMLLERCVDYYRLLGYAEVGPAEAQSL
jgi:hypothetical protein